MKIAQIIIFIFPFLIFIFIAMIIQSRSEKKQKLYEKMVDKYKKEKANWKHNKLDI